MSRWNRGSLLLAVGTSFLFTVGPAAAQQTGCTQSGAASSSSTTSGSTSNGGSRASTTSTQLSQTQIRTELARLQALLNELVSGQVTPPAGSGLTTAQAIQVVQSRINILQRLAVTTASSSAGSTAAAQRTGNSAALARSGGGRR